MAPAERYRTNKRKGRDKEAVRIVTGGEAKKFERRPEQIKDTTKRKGKLKTAIWSARKRGLDREREGLGGATARGAEEDEIRVQRVEEELVASTRERGAGDMRVRKRVRTEREQVRVPKRREEVSVERVPVEGREAPEAEIGEDEVTIPVTEEEVVIEKRPVVKEEIRVRKNVLEEEEIVEEYVRKEEVDIEDRTERGEGSERAKTADHETADRSSKGSWDEASLEEGGKADRKVRRKVRRQERTSDQERISNQERTSKKDQQRAASAEGTKGNQEEGLPVAEYDTLTVEEAKKRLSGLSEGELKKIRSYEKKHKNRKTLVRSLDHEIKKTH